MKVRFSLHLILISSWVFAFAGGLFGPRVAAAASLGPDQWGISAQCMYEAVRSADETDAFSCRNFVNEHQRVELIHEKDGVALPTPTYRFSLDESERDDDPYYVVVDIPTYQKNGEDSYFVPMEIGVNTGGSGWFSILGFGSVHPARQTIGPVMGIRAGDRCNDGYAEFLDVKRDSDGSVMSIQFHTAMTPFRLLNPTDKTDWRMLRAARALVGDKKDDKFPVPSTLNGWQPYKDVANAAQLCIGWVNKEFDFDTLKTRVVGVSISLKEMRSLEPQTPAEQCAFPVIKQNMKLEGGRHAMESFDLESWGKVLRQIESICGAKK